MTEIAVPHKATASVARAPGTLGTARTAIARPGRPAARLLPQGRRRTDHGLPGLQRRWKQTPPGSPAPTRPWRPPLMQPCPVSKAPQRAAASANSALAPPRGSPPAGVAEGAAGIGTRSAACRWQREQGAAVHDDVPSCLVGRLAGRHKRHYSAVAGSSGLKSFKTESPPPQLSPPHPHRSRIRVPRPHCHLDRRRSTRPRQHRRRRAPPRRCVCHNFWFRHRRLLGLRLAAREPRN